MREQVYCRDEAANHQLSVDGFLNHLDSFCVGMVKHNTKFDADSLLYSLSHFECNGHTVHMLTQWHLQLPLTSTVKSSLFTYVHSSPPAMTARLHGCRANCSHYISTGWSFSGQTLYSLWVEIWLYFFSAVVSSLLRYEDTF